VKSRVFIILLLMFILLGCHSVNSHSTYYQRSRELTLATTLNSKKFTNTQIYNEYSCVPESIALRANEIVEVEWGDDPEDFCGKHSNRYLITHIDGESFRAVSVKDPEDKYTIKIIELKKSVYGAKRIGQHPWVIYVPAR